MSPHSFPVRSAFPMLRECVPEMVVIGPPKDCRVHFLLADKDPTTKVGLECFQSVVGSIMELISFKGPAYRTLPAQLPMVSYQLMPREPMTHIDDEGDGYGEMPKGTVEAYHLTHNTTSELSRVGFEVRPLEYRVMCSSESVLTIEAELDQPSVVRKLYDSIVAGKVFYVQLNSFPVYLDSLPEF